MKRRIVLAAGLTVLLPTLGTAQAPPIQEDPLAKEHVLHLPPAYTPAGDTHPGDTPAGAAPQYGVPQVQSPQYGGQQQPYQTGGAAVPMPYTPRYGGSLLGAPNGQAPGGTPAYGPGQTAAPIYGNQPPQAGGAIPPVQSPRYDAGPAAVPNTAAQPGPYAAPNGDSRTLGGPGPLVTQQPLAPPPSAQPPTEQATAPATATPQATPSQAGMAAQTATDAQTAPAGQTPAGQAPAGQAPATADAAKTATATPAPPPPNVWLPAAVATLQALDKVNAQASTLTVKVGQSATFGSLTITVKSCVVRPPDQPADAAAYVNVADSHPDSSGFSGWLLENEPSVSIMQHPIYDLRVTGCA